MIFPALDMIYLDLFVKQVCIKNCHILCYEIPCISNWRINIEILPTIFLVKPLDQNCQENGLFQKIDMLTSSFEERNQEISGITWFFP